MIHDNGQLPKNVKTSGLKVTQVNWSIGQVLVGIIKDL